MSFTLLSPVLPPPGWSCREAFSQEFSLGDIQREEETGRSGWVKEGFASCTRCNVIFANVTNHEARLQEKNGRFI
jgi:hypothetical protein